MSGKHLAPESNSTSRTENKSKDSENTYESQSSSRSRVRYDVDPDYDLESRFHTQSRNEANYNKRFDEYEQTRSHSHLRTWVIVAALAVVIVAVGVMAFMLYTDLRGSSDVAQTADGITATITAQDSSGNEVASKLTVTESTQRPDTVEEDEELLLLDLTWTGNKDASYPLVITITDSSFTNDDGLAVYHYADGEWELIGTYLIVNHSVSFPADSLSPFAFQVISSEPETTATPEPTVTPESTATSEPTPISTIIDYGTYDTIQEGLSVQMESIVADQSYILAVVDEATNIATVLINYDDTKLCTVDVDVAVTTDGIYYLTGDVVEGMLWTATADTYGGETRYSLSNNRVYLNLDEDNSNVVLDDNDVRTRWLFETITTEDGEETTVLTYMEDSTVYYVNAMYMATDTTEAEAAAGNTDQTDGLRFTVTTESGEALTFILFQVTDGVLDESTGLISGILVATPTPAPTAVTSTNSSSNSSSGGSTAATATATAAPTAEPTAEPTAAPTAEPTAAPTANATDSDANTGSPPASDSDATVS
ncbi:MAG: PT domain-containing protein [Oscillospiraceae bacterium]|nr:PT domain-containing protein [Oscillospiraceae bacterium]